jgi:hypothetical protein
MGSTRSGQLQLDFVLHCGRTTAGEYVVTLSATDLASGWWEAADVEIAENDAR